MLYKYIQSTEDLSGNNNHINHLINCIQTIRTYRPEKTTQLNHEQRFLYATYVRGLSSVIVIRLFCMQRIIPMKYILNWAINLAANQNSRSVGHMRELAAIGGVVRVRFEIENVI